jgi:predicted esterase
VPLRIHHITVPRTARYVALGEIGPNLREIWFVLHGYGLLATEFLEQFANLNDGSRLIVAPEGLSRYYTDHATRTVGASWMTREDRLLEIDDYVRYLDLVHGEVLEQVERSRPAVTLLGFSQGAATVSRWVVSGRVRADRLILWGGLLPPELDLQQLRARLEGATMTQVVGERDPIAPAAAVKEQAELLRQEGIRIETTSFDGGHGIDATVLVGLVSPP